LPWSGFVVPLNPMLDTANMAISSAIVTARILASVSRVLAV